MTTKVTKLRIICFHTITPYKLVYIYIYRSLCRTCSLQLHYLRKKPGDAVCYVGSAHTSPHCSLPPLLIHNRPPFNRIASYLLQNSERRRFIRNADIHRYHTVRNKDYFPKKYFTMRKRYFSFKQELDICIIFINFMVHMVKTHFFPISHAKCHF